MTVEEIFERAVTAARSAATAEEYGQMMDLVREAAEDGPAALRVAAGRLADPDVTVRSTACGLLGFLADQHEELRADAATALITHAAAEADPGVLWALARALGHTADARAVPVLVELSGHGDSDIRYMVANSLPWVLDGDADGLAALLRLCRDDDLSVRDWATFGLGQVTEADGAAVRELLWERTTDEDEDVRAEGIRGLARRRDRRALPLVAELLELPEYDPLTSAAAGCLGDPSLAPLLAVYGPAENVADALDECDPDRRARRDAFAFAVFDAVATRRGDVSLYGERCEMGLYLGLDELTWSVGDLAERAGGDPERAAELVLGDVAA
jgi:HEAT repeat protein